MMWVVAWVVEINFAPFLKICLRTEKTRKPLKNKDLRAFLLARPGGFEPTTF